MLRRNLARHATYEHRVFYGASEFLMAVPEPSSPLGLSLTTSGSFSETLRVAANLGKIRNAAQPVGRLDNLAMRVRRSRATTSLPWQTRCRFITSGFGSTRRTMP